jgi:hypothetical protein
VADLFEHLAQLAVAALDEHHFVPWIVTLADLADACWSGTDAALAGLTVLDGDSAAQDVELVLGGLAADFDQVRFLHAGGGFCELVGQFAVVGHQEQAFSLVVEAAHGVEALGHLLKELHDGGPALGILDGGDKTLGLVEHVVAQALGSVEQLAVDADVVLCRVGLGSQLGDDLAVYLHAALGNHGLGAAAAGDAGLGEDLLQTLQFARGAGRGLF